MAVPVRGLPDCAGDGTDKVYDRIIVEACCNPKSVLSGDTAQSKGCVTLPITEEMEFASKEAARQCSDNLWCFTT
eukprot:10802454-Heterocapsa_arctica.AAC.1